MIRRRGNWILATHSGWFPLFLFSKEDEATQTGFNVKWRLWFGPLLLVRMRSEAEQFDLKMRYFTDDDFACRVVRNYIDNTPIQTYEINE